MPLSPPAERSLSHIRKIDGCGYQRSDGMWDIEADLQDTKSFDIPNQDRGGCIKQGEALHHMRVRITIDADMLIHDAEAVTEAAPYYLCGDITPHYKKLIGMRIAPGWNRAVKEAFAGAQGCTHITELLSSIATIAFQTVFSDKIRQSRARGEGDMKPTHNHLNTCHALRLDSAIVAREYPQFYKESNSKSDKG